MSDNLRIELSNCEWVLLNEIGMKEVKQKSVAMTYALALHSSERGRIDWQKVNRAIIDRWSISGLAHIKKLAWSGKAFA